MKGAIMEPTQENWASGPPQPEIPPTPTRPHVRKRVAAGLFGAGLMVGIIVAGLNVAGAQTASPQPSAGTDQQIERAPKPGRGHGGHKGFGMGIHGEFVTPAPNGGYQTLASQVGEVTSVSSSSITVKSEDGFSRTYAVDENTLVNAGRDGIGDVKNGDKVRVLALVADGKATAVQIHDGTNVERLHKRWRPPPPGGAEESAARPSSSSA
jgi:hypothetical protein